MPTTALPKKGHYHLSFLSKFQSCLKCSPTFCCHITHTQVISKLMRPWRSWATKVRQGLLFWFTSNVSLANSELTKATPSIGRRTIYYFVMYGLATFWAPCAHNSPLLPDDGNGKKCPQCMWHSNSLGSQRSFLDADWAQILPLSPTWNSR